MKIGEIAAATGVHVETIRYYEREGLVPPPARTASNYRSYGDAHRMRLTFIRRARYLGFSLLQVRELLDLADDRNRRAKPSTRSPESTGPRSARGSPNLPPSERNSTA